MALISEGLRLALVEQWGHEVYNSHIYLQVMAYLKNRGFDNIAKQFEDQYDEELGHAKIILNLLLDLNSEFKAPVIEEVPFEINSFMDIAQLYLEREIYTTESLEEIKQLAMEERNSVVEERIRTLIMEQQKEYAEATTMLDKAEIIGSDLTALLLYDASIGA